MALTPQSGVRGPAICALDPFCNPDPTETEARYWLAGNLCRCTGYDKVIRAVLDAAAERPSRGSQHCFGCKVSEPRIRHVNGNVDGSNFAPNADLLRLTISAGNVTMLRSSRGNEFSLEDDKWNNGTLTRVQLEPHPCCLVVERGLSIPPTRGS